MSITFSEITRMLQATPPVPPVFEQTQPVAGMEGPIQNVIDRIMRCQQQIANIKTPRLVIYAARHDGDSIDSLRHSIQQLGEGAHAINRLGMLCNADVRLYEMDIETVAPSLSESQAAIAITYGLMAVEERTDILLVSTLSQKSQHVAKILTDQLESIQTAEQALGFIAQSGATDICAALGASFAARMAGVPVMASYYLQPILFRMMSLLTEPDQADLFILPSSNIRKIDEASFDLLFELHHLQACLTLYPLKKKLTQLSMAS